MDHFSCPNIWWYLYRKNLNKSILVLFVVFVNVWRVFIRADCMMMTCHVALRVTLRKLLFSRDFTQHLTLFANPRNSEPKECWHLYIYTYRVAVNLLSITKHYYFAIAIPILPFISHTSFEQASIFDKNSYNLHTANFTGHTIIKSIRV